MIALTNAQQDGAINNNAGGNSGGSSSGSDSSTPKKVPNAKCSTLTSTSAPSLISICKGGTFSGALKSDSNEIFCVNAVCGTVDAATCCLDPTPYTKGEEKKRLHELSEFTTNLDDTGSTLFSFLLLFSTVLTVSIIFLIEIFPTFFQLLQVQHPRQKMMKSLTDM